MLDFDSWSGKLANEEPSLLERYIGVVQDMPEDSSKPSVRLVELHHLVLLGVFGEFEVHLVALVLAVNDVVG